MRTKTCNEFTIKTIPTKGLAAMQLEFLTEASQVAPKITTNIDKIFRKVLVIVI